MLLAAVCLIVTNCNMLKFGMYLSNVGSVFLGGGLNEYIEYSTKKPSVSFTRKASS